MGFSSWGKQALQSQFWAREHRLSSCGARPSLLQGMWDLSGSAIEPVSLALAGGFFTTESPGKAPAYVLIYILTLMVEFIYCKYPFLFCH